MRGVRWRGVRWRFVGASLGSVLALAGTAQAAISVNNAVVDFRPGDRPVKDVVVRNHDPQPAFVEVSLERVVDPGSNPETRETVDAKDAKLLVTPRKLVIPPNGEKLVRIISRLEPQATDAVYRATLTPVVTDASVRDGSDKSQIGVKVVVAYGLLIFVRPASLERRVDAERRGKEITFHNRGNTNVELQEGEQCVAGEAGLMRCEIVKGSRLYPGRSVTMALPFDAPIKFRYRMAGEYFVEAFD